MLEELIEQTGGASKPDKTEVEQAVKKRRGPPGHANGGGPPGNKGGNK
ncbi:hypothetical protein [Halapricum desulfuricans]|uniref:Uncharacterized protein n=1 Tax=Halapricum desulfuricans TaxID=2841257 RepID=A0A897N1T0_9EURY|nr:hypothetical protein [Halapricum desulfuricans]QSG06471.1 hypothetical protein HSR121_2140 [Halapricum desulfuricans]